MMPATPRNPTTPEYQKGRKHLRKSITLSPTADADYRAIASAKPELWSLSTCIAWALRVARESLGRQTPGS